jgi:hypothetical protein
MDSALVTLEGSEKQVAWATDMRTKVLADLEQMPKGAATQEWRDAFVAECQRVLGQIRKAKTWIDNRRGNFSTRVALMARAEGLAFSMPQ